MTLASAEFKTEFAVDMTCQSCVNSVSTALRDISGVSRYDIDLQNKRVVVTGQARPSQLYNALKSTKRQVIVRGTSSDFATTAAAVSILESPIPLSSSIASSSDPILSPDNDFTQKVFGICRLVQIAPKTILMDLTVRLPPPSNLGLQSAHRWNVYVSSTGNLVDPPRTTGRPFVSLGKITPDKDGYGDLFQEMPGELWEWIGRACVVEAESTENAQSHGRIFAGVVARSAGAWGNDKTVCACSGRTMWEEGRDMEKRV